MTTYRDINMLVPAVRLAWLDVLAELESIGIEVMVVETHRPHEIQHAYFAQGRQPLADVNRLRKKVGLWPLTEQQNKRIITKTTESMHFYDVALDFAILIDGKPSWDTKADINEDNVPDYENVGKIAEKHGFKWGGRFRFKDYAHIEFTGGLSLDELRAGKRPQADVLKYI